MKRINFGCGRSPTSGWENYDNSPLVWVSRHPFVVWCMKKLRLFNSDRIAYIEVLKSYHVCRADGRQRLPFADGSVEVFYTSNMLEVLTRKEVVFFLKEVRRVLMPNGIIRIRQTDLRQLVAEYNKSGDSDRFLTRIHYAWYEELYSGPQSWLRRILSLFFLKCPYFWYYDSHAMVRRLSEAGFREPVELKAGETLIPDTGGLNLFEDDDDSFFIEAYNS